MEKTIQTTVYNLPEQTKEFMFIDLPWQTQCTLILCFTIFAGIFFKFAYSVTVGAGVEFIKYYALMNPPSPKKL